jgi:glycosyltransferase involved in cell wall biosynthesis
VHWILAAPFIFQRGDTWLEPFVPEQRHTFVAVPARYRHNRSRSRTNSVEWVDYFRHAAATWTASRRSPSPTGIVTCFPQLALAVGLRKAVSRSATPLLAWTFNLGRLYGGVRRGLARFALSGVDLFVVHSRQEVDAYAAWLDVSRDKFRFVPLQRPMLPIRFEEDAARPFVLSMGSARRDYRLFVEVMADLGYPTTIVAARHALAELKLPGNVTVYDQLDLSRCDELAQRARINVVPIDNSTTASGQATLLTAMMYGRATVATLTAGTEDYAEQGKTALLVKAGSREQMFAAIQSLWNDKALRDALGGAARHYVAVHLSDEAAGRALATILDELASTANGNTT